MRLLPLFPLPVVLFPGVPLPLHIFEPRYRTMLADCMGGDRLFGILYRPEGADELAIDPGHVGCEAHVESAQELPDGRSNIIVTGRDRFALSRIVESALPYHMGEVRQYGDEPDHSAELDDLAGRVRATFERVGRAARSIADDPEPLPALPEDAGLLSFTVASMIDLDGQARQRLLTSRSPGDRLREIDLLLTAAVDALESRAALHQRAKSNGLGPSESS